MITQGPYKSLPTAVPGSNGTLQFTSIDVGTYHLCGIVTSGAAYCHGSGRAPFVWAVLCRLAHACKCTSGRAHTCWA